MALGAFSSAFSSAFDIGTTVVVVVPNGITFTRTIQGTEQPDGTFGAPTVTTIDGAGIFVQGTPQEYEAAGLTRTAGPTLLFTPTDYPLRAFTPQVVAAVVPNGITVTRSVPSAEASDGTFGAPTVTSIDGTGIFVQGTPQEYEAAGLTRTAGPTLLFTPTDYPLRAFTPEFVLPGDTAEIDGMTFTVTAILKVVAPDGEVIVSRIALSGGYSSEFVLPGDTTEINGVTFTVKAILKAVAPDGNVIVSRIALGV